MGKKKSNSAKKTAAAAASRGVVGPDYIQVLTGSIASKSISLILCGESHHDAIDITRAGGGKVKEGWVPTDLFELTGEMVGRWGGIEDVRADDDNDTIIRIKCGICKRNNKLLPLGKAKEWGREVGHEEIDYIEPGHEMALLWVPSKENDGVKGRSFLVELLLDESENEEDKSRSHFPSDVVDLLDSMSNAAKSMRGVKSLSKVVQDMKNGTMDGFTNEKPNHTLLSWADMDTEARLLNHRRILGDDISTSEYDGLINDRKKKRRALENTWTWDDWLVEVESKLTNGRNSTGEDDNPALHVVLESSIPPWEVELCRELVPEFEYAEAADCIRCLSEDSEESEMDAFDPASDGFGSYIDYLFRRLVGIERSRHGDSNEAGGGSKFLHCVDCRDLGCEHSCVEDSLHKDWNDLLKPEEKEKLIGSGPDATHAHHKDGRCLPDWSHSPEESKLDQLRSSGVLKSDDVDDQDSTPDDGNDLVTFPSMESFFGQCTDIMYYTPNCKIAYAPFLGKCVQSFDNWNAFFSTLFFGGTVHDALSMLDLSSDSCPYLHIRSPIMKFWNAKTGEYEWHKRENEEHDLTLSLLPIKSFLKARGSGPARTWCSNIFASLLECDCEEVRDMAIHTRQWIFRDIAKHCLDPKLSDDEIGGGEWFLAYLRQCHREIYDDIDRSDCAALLRKRYVAGENKRHKIGEITIPSCKEGFQLITKELSRLESISERPALDKKAEVMAKILIDIYMNKLVDASTMIKMAQIISKETKRNIVIVCYMGSVHTRAVCDFFTQPKYGFKKKIFSGKQDWDEEEGRILHLPAELWDFRILFK